MEANICDSKNKLVEALRDAARGNARSKTARLLEIIDEIEAAKASGLSHKIIVATLASRGLLFTQGTFEITRLRILKKRREGKPNIPPASVFPVSPLVRPAVPGQQKPISGDEIKKSLRGPVNLKQYE